MPVKNMTREATATIANGQTESDAVTLRGGGLVAIGFPAAMTGANVTFKAYVGGNWLPVYGDDGTEYSVTVTQSGLAVLNLFKVYPFDDVKVVSDAAEAAERTLTLVYSPI